jgi:hypothetical protein
MQRLAVALLLGGVLLLASWVVAGDPPPASQAPQTAPRPDQVAQLVDDVNQQVELLRQRLELERRFTAPHRNPFAFDAGVPSPVLVPPPVEPVIVPEPPAMPQLVAILTDKIEGGVARRAVFSVNGTVQIVKVGDAVDRFEVARIDADGVDLKGRDTSAAVRLSIK